MKPSSSNVLTQFTEWVRGPKVRSKFPNGGQSYSNMRHCERLLTMGRRGDATLN